MHIGLRQGILLLGLAILAPYAPGLRADPITFTYTYTGNPDFIIGQNEVGGDYPIFQSTDYVTATFTLDTPVDSEGVLTDYSSDVVSFTVSTPTLTIIETPNTYADLQFETTDGQITEWFMQVNDNPPDIPADWDFAQINSQNNGINITADFECVGDGCLGGSEPFNHLGNFDEPGEWEGPGSVPEPATIVTLLGGLALLRARFKQARSRGRVHAGLFIE